MIGADVTRASLQLGAAAARRFGVTGVQFVETDLQRPGLCAGAFDVIYTSGVLHHTRDPRQSFEAILPLLRPGGMIVIGLYNAFARIPLQLRRVVARLSGYRWIPLRSGVARPQERTGPPGGLGSRPVSPSRGTSPHRRGGARLVCRNRRRISEDLSQPADGRRRRTICSRPTRTIGPSRPGCPRSAGWRAWDTKAACSSPSGGAHEPGRWRAPQRQEPGDRGRGGRNPAHGLRAAGAAKLVGPALPARLLLFARKICAGGKARPPRGRAGRLFSCHVRRPHDGPQSAPDAGP